MSLPSIFRGGQDDRLINVAVDDSRNTLFTLSEKSVIKVYYLGSDGLSMSLIDTYTNTMKDAQALLSTITTSRNVPHS